MSQYPPYLRCKLMESRGEYSRVINILKNHELHTVCESARCPNRNECFSRGVATFMILGDVCTRHCRFCSVKKGTPSRVDLDEPRRVAHAARELHLSHVVITSVTRDDLRDGGAELFAATIRAIRQEIPATTIEALTPDFGGNQEAILTVLAEQPDVFNHNIETVPRLYAVTRPEANYNRSLEVLRIARNLGRKSLCVKSGLMVGFGESEEEVINVIRDLFIAGCDALTIGQYLKPGIDQIDVLDYITPAQFKYYYEIAVSLGFKSALSDVFVRSSYRSDLSYAATRSL